MVPWYSVDAIYKAVFRQFPAEGEPEIAQRIKQSNTDPKDLLKNDTVLLDLCRIEDKFKASDTQHSSVKDPASSLSAKPKTTTQRDSGPDSQKLRKLKDDVTTDVDTVIQENLRLFLGKLKIELERIEANLKDTVERTGDRVIDVLSGGPWESIASEVSSSQLNSRMVVLTHIFDKDMYNIWKYIVRRLDLLQPELRS